MSKRIGILGGISHQSTAKYYELIHTKYYERYKDHYYPEIAIFSFNFQKFTDYENSGDMQDYIGYILSGVCSLENAGVDFILMAANSPHAVFDEVEKKSEVPVISIAETAAQKAAQDGLGKLLLMGIKFTMQASFYKDICKKYNIDVIVPDEEEQNEINRIIFEELVPGIFKEKSKQKLLGITRNYEVDGVILGCTELPLILKQEDSDIPLLDTMGLHVEAALREWEK